MNTDDLLGEDLFASELNDDFLDDEGVDEKDPFDEELDEDADLDEDDDSYSGGYDPEEWN
jgi:hypothetical protein